MTTEIVRYRYQRMAGKHIEQDVRCALVHRANKYLHVLMMLPGKLSVIKVPLTEERYMTPLERKGKPYPMSRALTSFRRFGRSFGMTKGAKAFLRRAAA